MREALALVRAGWLAALSYRVNLLFSVLGLVFMLVPVYFVAPALQSVAAASIQTEGKEYFSFLVVGLAVLTVTSTALTAFPATVGSSIGSGTLEAMLATPARLPAVLLGLIGYEMSWSVARATLMLAVGMALGMTINLSGVPLAMAALFLILVAYLGLGLALAGMILVFRTIGPLGSGLVAASALLGGVYYSTSVIPSWVRELSSLVPLTYGLRVIRQTLLTGAGFRQVSSDLMLLTLLALLLLALGATAFGYGLRHARREGTLGQY
jgi:ABC-2 type transport system permease protein